LFKLFFFLSPRYPYQFLYCVFFWRS